MSDLIAKIDSGILPLCNLYHFFILAKMATFFNAIVGDELGLFDDQGLAYFGQGGKWDGMFYCNVLGSFESGFTKG